MKDKKTNHPNVQIDVNLDTTPILYTDNIFIHLNDFGLVLDMGQKLGNSDRVRLVSRIGMSRNHAAKFVGELNKLLVMTEGSKKIS